MIRASSIERSVRFDEASEVDQARVGDRVAELQASEVCQSRDLFHAGIADLRSRGGPAIAAF